MKTKTATWTAALCICGLAWASPLAQGQAPTPTPSPSASDQDIKEIEQRIAELNRKLDELRKARTTSAATAGGPEGTLPADWVKAFVWRELGPATMGGRITAITVCETDPSVYWIATASGGLLKTTNNGGSFEHQFDKESTVSIGSVCVAPSNKDIVWVGTGENNPRNSVSYGDGVYKSTDGGKTWVNMGLKSTYQIGKILVHPKNPDIVYVGALGRLYGPNPDRGLFKTTDGGKTWSKVLFVDDKTGVIDMIMNPNDPETLIIATWERQRDGFDSWPGDEPKADGYDGYDPIKKWGAGSGLHKTTDGGKTFRKLTKGLPKGTWGRIGIDYFAKDPNLVFAIIDAENIGKGKPPLQTYLGVVGQDEGGKVKAIQILPDSPAAKAGMQVGDLVTAIGDKTVTTFDELVEAIRARKVNDKLTVKAVRGSETKSFETTLAGRPGQGAGGGAGAGPGGAGMMQAVSLFGAAGGDREGKPRLVRVFPETAAAKAGAQDGDVILEYEGKAIESFSAIVADLQNRKEGDKVKLKVQRGQETKDLTATLENRPVGGFGGRGGGQAQAQAQAESPAYLGIMGENAEGGARLTTITERGPADKAGLQEGDVIQAVGDQKIANYDALVARLRTGKPGEKLELTVLRGKETKKIAATMEAREGSTSRPYNYMYGGQSPNVQDMQGSQGSDLGGVYKSTDGGESWTRVNSLNPRPMYFSHIKVDPSDDKRVYVLGVAQHQSSDGGQTFNSDFGRSVHADGHFLWINPKDGRHMIIGTDGGYYVTYDRGANWDHLNLSAIGQFYHVDLSSNLPYSVAGGLQDNGSWAGPSLSLSGSGTLNEDWISVGGGDGYTCRFDPHDPNVIFWTSQDGGMGWRNIKTGEGSMVRPPRRRGGPTHRFNWSTPYVLSKHNSKIFYCGSQYVMKSADRGRELRVISPEITLTKRGSATALSESSRNPDILWAGTDDGGLWVTKDGGKEWTNVTAKLGLPAPRWVATVEASRFEDGRAYVALDAHRSDDDQPYLFVTEDFGQTWKPIRANLPVGSTRCLREDLQNPDLLYCGTEFGIWVSLNRGGSWTKLHNNLPTVAVHEIAMHPTAGEIVAATHGRSLWALDVTALRQITAASIKDKPALYKPNTLYRWRSEPGRGGTNRRYISQNPVRLPQIFVSIPKKVEKAELKVYDINGAAIRELRLTTLPGLHRISWEQLQTPPRPAGQGAPGGPGGPGGGGGGGGGGGRFRGGFGGGFGGGPPAVGSYRVVVNIDGQETSQVFRVENDPRVPASELTASTLPFSDPQEEDSAEEERERLEKEREKRDRERERINDLN